MDIFKKLSYIFDKKQKKQFAALTVMLLVGGILETMSFGALIPVISLIINEEAVAQNEKVQKIMNFLHIESIGSIMIPLLFTIMVLFVLKNIFILWSVNQKAKFIATNRNKLISRVLREFLNRPYEFYLDADIPTVFRLTDSDIPNVFGMLMAITSLISEAVVVVLLGTTLVAIDFKLTVFMVVVLAIMSVVVSKILEPRVNKIGQKNQETQSRIAKWRIEAIYGIKDVKVLHRENFFADSYEETGKVGAVYSKDYSVMNSLPRLLIETVFIVCILGYIIVYELSGNSVSQLVTMISALGVAGIKLLPSVNRINTYLTEIAYYRPCLDYVYENLNINALNEKNNPMIEAKNPDAKLSLKNEISLSGIVYAYPNTDKLIFDHAKMSIPYGKSVGIMGPSGAGKSTIVDILLGLLRLQEGSITCDGVDVFDNYPAWLAQIGYIPQSIYLIDEPIRNNIAFGIADEAIEDARVWQVLEEAQMKEFVESLPQGLDTTIGDRGVRLSGGQRQRLGIARALYHNPEILVFDEATSALDNDTEAAVMEAINSFHGKKTMVIIAHRLNTIEKCDIIYKVDEGKITEVTL
ncbi:MAG: ABC transporter ATP-binding protein [Lachnospiraceae bacterium]|nr:ABC transporter ATP-binding protein [Lachnospiraceae bacterium]